MMRLACILALLLAGAAGAATPLLEIPGGRLGAPGSRVHPNVLLNLSLTFADAGAAHRGPYLSATAYAGYFNATMCYSYPMKRRDSGVLDPDLEPRKGYFSIAGAADRHHECGGDAFSGNFLNWATASTFDLLRYALTGGDRVIDEPGQTVLQRAWLPDGRFHADFYANPQHFARKSVNGQGGGSAPAKVTPFAADTLYIVSCRNRVLFSKTMKGSSCDADRFDAAGRLLESDKYFGEFNVRVDVCSSADAAGRPDLCARYPNGVKPEGGLHTVSGKARIGVMSYLTEFGALDANLYGGVLRAPLKFVGATAFGGAGFDPLPNRNAEWNADSGVLAKNPDRSSAASGAINYINQLGRSNDARLGAYRSADPGAELFYESVRYLQGRASGVAVAGVLDDRFAVWRTRADPIAAACQCSAVATIGHASFINDRGVPGNTRVDHGDSARTADSFAPSGPFDVMQSARRVGAMEADPDRGYANGAPRPDLLKLDTLDNGPDGAGSYYLAGAAFWAHVNAIRPDKEVRIDSFSLELGAVSKPGASALYLSAKYGEFDDRNDDANPFITAGGRKDDSEWRAGIGGPAGYFAAADGQAVVASVRALLARAAARRGRQTGVAVVAGDVLIHTAYDLSRAAGSLQRWGLSVSIDGNVKVGGEPLWDAAAKLDGSASDPPRPLPSARKIYTLAYRDDKSVTLPFVWDSLLAEQQAYLDRPAPGAPVDGLGEARTDFLRGDQQRELGHPDGVFRRRASVLGDIVHGVPLVVGPPSPAGLGKRYADFHERYKKRPKVVYLGANDGMLHAFNADDGSELFAYVPHALVPALNLLTSPGYDHRPYVDGSAGQGEASIGGVWRSVLASGMGMGARGVFALDISDPANFDKGMGALWEFTDKDDPAMGHVSAPPLIARFTVAIRGNVPEYRHFVVLASGINNYTADDKRGDGALFLLALDKPAAEPWKRGVNYYRFDTPIAELSSANALAPPVLAIGANGSVRYAYAGDLQGTLWRFDFSGTAPWPAPEALFVARDAAGRRQPVTHAPKIVFAPSGGYLVLFGTGKFIEESDLRSTSFTTQSFYAIHDSLAKPFAAVRSRSELAERRLSGSEHYQVTGDEAFYGGVGASKGWYFDFPHTRDDGERAVGGAVLVSGTLLFDTVLPSADVCAAPSARSYRIDALSGFAARSDGVAVSGAVTGEWAEGAALAPPLLIETSALVGASGATGQASAIRTFAMLRMDRDGKTGEMRSLKVRLPARRMSWREIANWQELHDATKK